MILKKILSAAGTAFVLSVVTSLISAAVNTDTDFWHSLIIMPIYLVFSAMFIFAVGLPVSVVSYFIVRNRGKSRRFLNFSIHVFSAAAAGFILSIGSLDGVLLTVFAGFLFFLFDEVLLYHRKHVPVRVTKWDGALGALVLIGIGIPIYLSLANSGGTEGEVETVDLSKPPVVSVVWKNSALGSIKPQYCKVESEACTKDMAPYYTDSLKGDVLDTYYSNTFTLSAANRVEEPEFEIYYLEGEEVKELRPVNGVYVVPLGLKDQVMKGNAIWKNEILTFEAAVNMIEASPAK
ncbi:hypothetical protein ACTSEZ_00225 [Metabacillus sp. JX24]|uniref:hypothetical protein n=1 Tax=Metabacillus sp. JX24 TaxID=3240759 RepID=UPI00350FC989